MFLDSVQEKIILGFSIVDKVCNVSFRGIVSFDKEVFKDLDVGVQTHDIDGAGAPHAQICIPYNNKSLYAGNFQSVGSNTLFTTGLALWNGTKWDTFPQRAFKYYPNKYPVIPTVFKENNNLFIGGLFDTIANIPVKNFCYFDGTSFFPLNISNRINYGVRKIIKYKNELYLSGLFFNSLNSTYSRIIRYTGGQAFDVGNGITGNVSSVQDMLVYNDTLFVAGAFSKWDGNIGNHIMKWDGTQFLDAGFGNFYDWGAIWQLVVFKNRLYAFGNFMYAADKKAYGAAFYENGKWTVNKDSMTIGIVNATVLKNSIYVAGGFSNINGDTALKFFARLKCPDFDGCVTTNAEEKDKPYVYPNPFTDKITIELPVNSITKISVINTLGQILLTFQSSIQKQEIDLSFLASGVYYISLKGSSRQENFKIIKD